MIPTCISFRVAKNRRNHIALIVCSSALWFAACGGGTADNTRRRIVIDAPSTPLDVAAWEAALGCEVEELDAVVALRWSLAPESWQAQAQGVFGRAQPLPARLADIPGTRMELRSNTRAFEHVVGARAKPMPGSFHARKKRIFVRLHEDGGPPPALTYSVYIPRGLHADGEWQVSNGAVSGPGLPILSGEHWSSALRIPESMALRFFTTVRGQGEDAAKLHFRVALDGETIWEVERRAGFAEDAWHTLPLPASRGPKASVLEFSVSGDPAWAAFVAPTIGPLDPPAAERPDIVLFMADTFRADNLAAYGGPAELTPNLNRLADEGVLFERAWATSSWTLPSQASMFCGVLPPKHGALAKEYMLPDALPTIVEALARGGYRTGGITDSGFVSARYNFHQGFEWYVEYEGSLRWNLRSSLERALEFLRAADGRPTFLFLQTYRTHAPYRVGAEESLTESMAFLQEQAGGETGEKALAAIHSQEAVEGLRRFYLQGVRDLDAKFSAWWSQMGQLKGASNRYLVFTSDHGEAFYEHGNSSHHGSMWEEVLRIPLIIVGPGVQPRRESFAASLVDFPRTLASIAGIPKADEWQGTNLLSLDADRPVYGFYKAPNQYELVVIDGLRKLFWDAEHSDRPPARAYDLGRDPGERTDVATDSSWPQDLADKHLREIQRLMQSATPGTRLGAGALSEEALENLRAIGYAGD